MTKYFFLPGLGADKRLFTGLEALSPAVYPDYIKPKDQETLEDYSQRLVETIDYTSDDVLIGFSFGGICALEMAKKKKPKAIVLIASLRSYRGNTLKFKLQTYAMKVLPDSLLKTIIQSLLSKTFKRDPLLNSSQHQMLDSMAAEIDIAFFRWASTSCANWRGDFLARPLDVPVHSIHGENDQIIPKENLPDVHVIQGANHLIQYTHAEEVQAIVLKNTSA